MTGWMILSQRILCGSKSSCFSSISLYSSGSSSSSNPDSKQEWQNQSKNWLSISKIQNSSFTTNKTLTNWIKRSDVANLRIDNPWSQSDHLSYQIVSLQWWMKMKVFERNQEEGRMESQKRCLEWEMHRFGRKMSKIKDRKSKGLSTKCRLLREFSTASSTPIQRLQSNKKMS